VCGRFPIRSRSECIRPRGWTGTLVTDYIQRDVDQRLDELLWCACRNDDESGAVRGRIRAVVQGGDQDLPVRRSSGQP
jgi:hypothetical protein